MTEANNTTNFSCDGQLFKPLPWTFYADNKIQFWVHYGLVITGFLIAVITFIVQWLKPAPYGKHDKQGSEWGALIHQRVGHILSDALPGVVLFILVFFLYGHIRDPVNIVFLIMFEAHYIHRGIIHPIITPYSNPKVALGITLGGLFPNSLFHFINADWTGSAKYCDNYYYDPRFLSGIILYVTGYVINRWADFKLKRLRRSKGTLQGNRSYGEYYLPHGGLFNLVACPNYFGEFIQWFGWSLATWSLAGLVWWLFCAATFIPRSRHNLLWYKQQFEDFPSRRKTLIPFII